MLIHIYLLTPQRNIEVTICKHQLILCVAWCLIWLFASLEKNSMVIHDTECPYWDQVSLNNTNQTNECYMIPTADRSFSQAFHFCGFDQYACTRTMIRICAKIVISESHLTFIFVGFRSLSFPEIKVVKLNAHHNILIIRFCENHKNTWLRMPHKPKYA